MVSSLLVGADEGFLQGGRGDVGGAWSRGESVEGLHHVCRYFCQGQREAVELTTVVMGSKVPNYPV